MYIPYKHIFAILWLCIYVNVYAQNTTKLHIVNQAEKAYVVYDYFSQDSLFASRNETDSFVLDNENQLKTLLLFVNNTAAYNIIILEKNEISITINPDESLAFEANTINNEYLLFQKGLQKLKSATRVQKQIDDYIFKFYFEHAELLLALEYAHASALYKIYSKDSCQLLFHNLNQKLQNQKLWAKTEKLLTQEVKELETEALLPKFRVVNTKKEEVVLDLKQKESLLVFWASSCAGCMQAIEQIKLNANKLEAYSIVFINLDKEPTAWLQTIEKHQLHQFTNYHLAENFENEMALAFKINAIPHYALIANNGKIIQTKFDLFQLKKQNKTIYFKNNAFELNTQQKQDLNNIFDAIKPSEIRTISISGFANKIGNEASNLLLSKNRIESIKQYLVNTKGINQNSINTKAFGEIDHENLEESRKVNIAIYKYELDISQSTATDSCVLIFEYRSTRISPAGNKCLKQMIEKTKEKTEFTIQIKTFSCGHEAFYTVNEHVSKLTYSEARAKTIKNFLLRNGFKESKLNTEAMGIDNSLESKENEHYKKRRAEIVLSY